MSDPATDVDRLFDLMGIVCDEDASHGEVAELETLAIADRDACRRYLGYCRMHSTLRLELHAQLATQKVQRQIASESASPALGDWDAMWHVPCNSSPAAFPTGLRHSAVGCFFSSGWPLAYLISAVLIGVGLFIGSFCYTSHSAQIARQSAPVPSSTDHWPLATGHSDFVGRVTGMVDCKFSDQSTTTFSGTHVPLGRKYALSAGLLEITYDTGAKVILQGPCTYEVESTAGGFLTLGKLTARVEKRGEGRMARGKGAANYQILNPKSQIVSLSPLFTIKTPTAVITDLGTEFGIAVDEKGGTVAHLFRGAVEVQLVGGAAASQRPVRLRENESVRVERKTGAEGLTVHRDHADATAFVRVAELSNLAKQQRLSSLHRWQAYSRQLRNDPTLIAYYTFEQQPGGTGVLPNQSTLGQALDGTVAGAEWVYGRLPDKFALLFHGAGSGDKVVLPAQERFNFSGPFSVAVWLKVSRFAGKWEALVTKGNSSWRFQQYIGDDVLSLDTNLPPNGRLPRTESMAGKTGVADGRWHLATAVYEPAAGGVKKQLYLDGHLDAEGTASAPLNHIDKPVWIGSNSESPGREFSGLIDEVAIFGRALSAQEVEAMHRAGQPDSY